jgi:purine-nucleoside phosphorylase
MTTDNRTAAGILHKRGVTEPIDMALVLGTGLGSIADEIEQPVVVPYSELPGFPAGQVSGHAGRLVVGRIGHSRIAVMQGRAHYYETGNPAAMATPLETLAVLGAKILLLTNSAGSLHADWHPGSLAVIGDHINFSGANPLIGASSDDRFVPLGDAYDTELRRRLHRAGAASGTGPLHEGVYMWFSGPSFETPAEIRAAKLLGADLVGMSTVPEVILARRLGLRVAALSVITNFGTGIAGGNPSHTETKQVALTGALSLKELLRAFVSA